jgi:ribosomal protein S18 acetylase RimI-like enzyme
VDVLEGDGIVAELDGRRIGLTTWLVATDGLTAEIRAVAVDAAAQGRGIGRALLEAAREAVAAAGARSAWLVTTNDNAPAIRLYESLGYRLVEVRRGAVDGLRRSLKPSIPLIGHGGVEMHDELELRRDL